MTCQYILHYTLDYVLKTTSSITAKKTQDRKEKNKTQKKRKKKNPLRFTKNKNWLFRSNSCICLNFIAAWVTSYIFDRQPPSLRITELRQQRYLRKDHRNYDLTGALQKIIQSIAKWFLVSITLSFLSSLVKPLDKFFSRSKWSFLYTIQYKCLSYFV